MKERPIIMSGNHPKLILDGIKTQTRRVIKPQPKEDIAQWTTGDPFFHFFYRSANAGYSTTRIKCPYGQVGSGLWVRETWAADKRYDHLKPSEIPDTAKIYYLDRSIHSVGGYSLFTEIGKVRPSMFMCEWMSRITLEITEVRVERVQEISQRDIIAEACNADIKWQIGGEEYAPLKTNFASVWDSLNAKRGYSWSSNPFVWVINFKAKVGSDYEDHPQTL